MRTVTFLVEFEKRLGGRYAKIPYRQRVMFERMKFNRRTAILSFIKNQDAAGKRLSWAELFASGIIEFTEKQSGVRALTHYTGIMPISGKSTRTFWRGLEEKRQKYNSKELQSIRDGNRASSQQHFFRPKFVAACCGCCQTRRRGNSA